MKTMDSKLKKLRSWKTRRVNFIFIIYNIIGLKLKRFDCYEEYYK